eukprot:NODE_2929_length_1087_cov_32.870906_g2686_i0.p1 GENE.NODE_2929_length_1087_cov_32.870906_g2686_i0~~NODE_2929_length_1087_cov_32.870906_g2686_i0.p1  ORF type:complete len:209 (-),score=45.37 NODE_2929_length_1087_cov_32.870906_g2686_i0:47-673(-)
MKTQLEQCQHTAKKAGTQLRSLGEFVAQNPQDSQRYQKLQSQFQTLLNDLKKISAKNIEKQRSLIAKDQSAVTRARQRSIQESSVQESDSLIEANLRKQKQLNMESEVAFNEAIIAEREESIVEVEGALVEINQIMLEMSKHVAKQGEALDLVEDQIDATLGHTEEANRELSSASKYQKGSRKKLCFLLIVLLVAVGALVLYFLLRSQ